MTSESPSQGCLALLAGKRRQERGLLSGTCLSSVPTPTALPPTRLLFLFASALFPTSIECTGLTQRLLHPPDPEKQGQRLEVLEGEMIWLKDGGQWGPQRGVLGKRITLQTWAEPPNAAMRV